MGTTFTVTDETGMYGTVKVRLDKITYGLAPYDAEYAPAAGNQLVGVQVWAQAVTLNSDGEASVNPVSVTALGSDGIGYEAGDSGEGMAAMMASTFEGDFEFAGQHETGELAFEMPKGVTVVSVKYDGGDQPVTWAVGE